MGTVHGIVDNRLSGVEAKLSVKDGVNVVAAARRRRSTPSKSVPYGCVDPAFVMYTNILPEREQPRLFRCREPFPSTTAGLYQERVSSTEKADRCKGYIVPHVQVCHVMACTLFPCG
jgi:hypothetical protein